jgi:hypothetical protein
MCAHNTTDKGRGVVNIKKVGIMLVTMSLVLVATTLILYGYQFHEAPLSNNIQDWGAFGSYLGGVLGATIPTLALIGAVIAIFQQQSAFLRSNNQILASDILRTIERLEDEIDRSLKEQEIRIDLSTYNYIKQVTAYDIATKASLSMLEKAIPHFEDCSNEFKKEGLNGVELGQRMELYELFITTSNKLKFMIDLIGEHKRQVGNNIAALYYKKKYGFLTKRLIDKGYPVEPMSDIEKLVEAL